MVAAGVAAVVAPEVHGRKTLISFHSSCSSANIDAPSYPGCAQLAGELSQPESDLQVVPSGHCSKGVKEATLPFRTVLALITLLQHAFLMTPFLSPEAHSTLNEFGLLQKVART